MKTRADSFDGRNTKRSLVGCAVAAALAFGAAGVNAASLTLFHNNDGESKLQGDANFGGIDAYVNTLNVLRTLSYGRDQLTISSGDNFLAGSAFNASLNSGPLGARTYFDGLALAAIQYDAITLGNHDFDFGPEVLADFINFYKANGGTATYLSSNLDFSAESSLQALVNDGSIAKSSIVTRGTEKYGIIGATTQTLDIVSNPGGVVANDVLTAVQAEVTALQNAGVNKIILSSHLQSINNELALVQQLRGVDVVIAGGGDELLINTDNARNSASQASGNYPLTVQDADGKNVAVVTTVGEYLYVGKLDVEFDDNGEVVNVSGEPVVVQKATNANVQATILDPLADATAAANAAQIGTTNVFLEHSQGDTNGPRVIRDRETNLGNLVADAFVWAVQNEVMDLSPGATLIGLTNGGGIREDLDNDQNGIITQGEAQAVLPFPNTMAVVKNMDVATLVAALENSVSALLPGQIGSNGRFGHISGISFDYNRALASGSRVLEVRLADGTVIWTKADGDLYGGTFDLATNSFLAATGTPDGYDFGGLERVILSTGYADALIGYITQALGGVVDGADYPLGGEGRINAVPLPAAAWLMLSALGGLGLTFRRRA